MFFVYTERVSSSRYKIQAEDRSNSIFFICLDFFDEERMQQIFLRKFRNLWSINHEFKLKVFLLSLTFLFMSGCLVIWRPLKVAVFAKMVGPTYVPIAKLLSLCILIPLILLYSKLVDWLRRHQMMYVFTIWHGIGGLLFYFLLAHPTLGVANTTVSSDRYIGWAFYFFTESFDAFFATSFWSFADSVNNPKDARNYYGFFVSGSKIGGIISAGLLYLAITFGGFDSQTLLPKALVIGSFLLFAAAGSIYTLIRKVPESKMHGYEAVYQFEKNKPKDAANFWHSLRGAFDGLRMIISSPYVLGIFSLVFFYEIVIVVFDYLVMIQADAAHPTISSLTGFYAFYYFMLNVIGLGVSFFGTTPLLRIFGLRLSLFAYPILTIGLLVITILYPYGWVLVSALVWLRALNYALNHPTREALYIPTVKEIKFKAKTWTDAFGSRIAKSSGSLFNMSMNYLPHTAAVVSSISLSIGVTVICLFVTYFLGKKFQHCIDNRLVIGSDTPSSQDLAEFDHMHDA